MHKIQQWSRLIRIFFQLTIIAIPIVCLAQWVFSDTLAITTISSLRHNNPYLPPLPHVPYFIRFLCFVISMTSYAVVIFALYHLVKLFRLYERGKIFTKANIKEITICSHAIFLWLVVDIISSSLLVVVLTMHNPVGQRLLTIGISSKYLAPFVIAVVASLIAQIMDEARKLKDENDHIV